MVPTDCYLTSDFANLMRTYDVNNNVRGTQLAPWLVLYSNLMLLYHLYRRNLTCPLWYKWPLLPFFPVVNVRHAGVPAVSMNSWEASRWWAHWPSLFQPGSHQGDEWRTTVRHGPGAGGFEDGGRLTRLDEYYIDSVYLTVCTCLCILIIYIYILYRYAQRRKFINWHTHTRNLSLSTYIYIHTCIRFM